MTVKKTQQSLNATLEKTEQTLGGLENSLGNNEETSLLATAENSEANDGLPEGWCETTLGQFTEYGKTKKVERKDVSDDLWLLELEDVEKGSSKIVQRLSVSERAFKSTKNKFEKGSVLYGKLRPYLNKIVMAPEDGVCTTEIIPINVEPFGSNKYLFYWLKSGEFLGYVNKVSYAVNMPRLGTKDGLSAPLVLPPLAEQIVIAQTLDTLLAQVDNIKTCLDAIPNILKTFRQSVLAAAVSGKLTEEWRGENESRFENKEMRELALDEKYSLAIGPFGSNLKVSDYENEGHPLVFVREIRANSFGGHGTKFVSTAKFEELKAHRVNPGEVLITKMGDPPGDVAIYPEDRESAVITSDCIKLKVDESKLLKKYAYYAMKSEFFRLEVLKISAGVAQQKVNLKKFRLLELPVPPIKEQTQIVHRVEKLFTFADQIEQQVKNAQKRVNTLTQSILAKAFRGELTAQWRAENPDLITGDNSAEALLAKIQLEREALKQKTKPKKKTALKKAVNKK
jgi:type I restriction enzyme S subunit